MISRTRCVITLMLTLIIVESGCVYRQYSPALPEKVYTNFRNEFGTCNATGITAKASLYYTSNGQGHRTTMEIWGYLSAPLRLDVRAGIGAYLAHILEDEKGLTVFYPDQEEAFTHSSPSRAATLLGLPFPFSLKELAGLVVGCYPELIPDSYETATPVRDSENILFIFNKGPVSSIELTAQGFPVEITGRGEILWKMKLDSYALDESNKFLPNRITIYTQKNEKAILYVKSRMFTQREWSDKSLRMELPEEAKIIKLD